MSPRSHLYMLLSSLSLSFIIFAIIIYIRSNPLSIGIIVLLIALTTTFIISLIMSSWICFLVFLIYIRGMLVLFSYFVAITPNIPMPSLTINMTLLTLIPIILATLLLYPSTLPLGTQPELYIPFLYSMNSTPILVLLALVLLLTIIIVVKLISIKKGPLRPFNYV